MTNTLLGKQIIETGIHAICAPVHQQFDAVFIKFVPEPLYIIIPHLACHYAHDNFGLFGRDLQILRIYDGR
jgi:hypothetical protein